MKEDEASETARRVAVTRLALGRRTTPYGDPGADERLHRDVAGRSTRGVSSAMASHIARRTRFFDDFVVRAIDAGITALVVLGAGYDGRALRYAKPGVGWFELDHPATQADKRRRVERIGADAGAVTFVAIDFESADLHDELGRAGHDASAPSAFLCEGVAVYLERAALEALLSACARRSAAGSRLAISLPIRRPDSSGVVDAVRARAVAAIGEPWQLRLEVDEVEPLLASCGWRIASQSGGLVAAEVDT